MTNNNLVILSLPFQRLIRSHMSPLLLDTISSNADVLVVTPFANDSEFVERYGNKKIRFMLPPHERHISKFAVVLQAISSMLRQYGYWYRWKKIRPYHWVNRYLQFGENGSDNNFGFGRRLLIDTLGLIGYSSKTWRFFDLLHGWQTYRFPDLVNMTSKYRKVAFVQAASWGFQDAVLGYWSRTKKWRSILLPYTTDQLSNNGWLYCDFNKICVQGEYELKMALEFHNYKLDSIIKLGSLNAFAMRKVLRTENIGKSKLPFRILFAGSISTYFPTESEFYCLDILISALESGKLGNSIITYRPIGHNKKIRSAIENRYGACKYINIEYANPSIYNLNKFENLDYLTILNKHVSTLCEHDLLVMAGATSLCLDFAYLNKPSVSVFIDNTGVLEKRNSKFLFNDKRKLHNISCVPTVFTEVNLIQEIQFLMRSSNEREKIVKGLNLLWDFPNKNFSLDLKAAIFED